MGKRAYRILVALFACMLSAPAIAQDGGEPAGKPGTEYQSADGLENWTTEYDVSGLKPGSYNLLARAVDAAGNVTFAIPFDLIVDPASDLPIAGIVNPLPLSRVGADLNVVGTCVDDDAVSHVELRLDDGEWVRAVGSDYWSYYLPTAGVADGLHTISARGVDSNGLVGGESSVSFHLDRTKPLHEVSKPAFGAIASGRLTVTGTVYDANGLSSVSYSGDSGETWQPLRHSYDKKTKTASFSLAVDTRKLDDGPAVLWLKSVDAVGSEGVAVFLYFVDNTAPELVALSPADGEAVNGRFELRGRVYDTVGLRSLSWAYGKETGEAELVPGNPYFSIPFTAPAKSGPMTVKLTATDVAGNQAVVGVTRRVDPAADLPTVALAYPAPESTLEGTVRVVGMARDDDGVASVAWSLDGGPETLIPSAGAFSIELGAVPSGRRELSLRAVDSNGLAGPWLRLPFVYSGAAPSVAIERASDATGSIDFAPGVAVSTIDGKASLQGSVRAANPLVELSYAINGGAPMKLPFSKTADGASFTLPLSPSLPYGALDLRVEAVDSFGKRGAARAPVLAIDYSRTRVGPLLDFGLAAEPSAAPSGSPLRASADAPTVTLRDGSPLVGAFVTPFDGEAPRSVRLEPETGLLRASIDGMFVRVERVADGRTAPTAVIVETERGHVFSEGPFTFETDDAPPAIAVVEPAFGSWLRGRVTVRAEASDGDGVASLEYAIDGGEWTALAADGAKGGSYSGEIDLAGRSGPVRLDLRAIDPSGNASTVSTAFMADSAAPAPVRLLPRPGDLLAGPTLFAFEAGEGLQSLERVELDSGGGYEPLEPAALISFTADPAAGLRLRLTDRAGNSTELDPADGLEQAEAPAAAPAPLEAVKTNAGALPADLSGPIAVFTGSDATGALSFTAPVVREPDEAAFPDYAKSAIRASGAASLSITLSGVSPDPKKPTAFWGYGPGELTQPLALKKGAAPDQWTAAVKLAPRPDGRSDVWVAVTEASGELAYARAALEYDSTPPAIEILAPAAADGKAASPGDFTLVVRASDAAGVAALSYVAGDESGGFELAPGSGDAARRFSFPPKAGSVTIRVIAVDGSGNRSQSTLAVAYDAEADAPKARFLAPADGDVLADGPARAFVYASDDDYLAGATLTVDGVAVEASGAGPLYVIDLGEPKRGKRAAMARAADATGVSSVPVSISFVQRGAAPRLSFTSVMTPASAGAAPEPAAFRSGSALVSDGKTVIVASAEAPNGLAKAEWALNGGAWSSLAAPKPAADGSYELRLPLPAGLAYERNLVRLRVTDAFGQAAEASASFYRVAPDRGLESTAAEGVYLYDERVADGAAVIAPGTAIGSLWYGRPVAELAIEPPVEYAEATFDGRALRLTGLADGGVGAEPVTLVVRTVDGESFRSSPLRLVVDSGPPALTIAEPASGAPTTGSWRLAGEASDANGLAELAWSADGGLSWTPLERGDGPAYSAELSPEADDGPVGLLVRAVDGAGAASYALTAVARDTAAPALSFETPRAVDTVNGTVLLSGYAEDASTIVGVEYSPDGVAWEALEGAARGAARGAEAGPADTRGLSFSRLVDLGSLPEGGLAMALRATDASGNVTTIRPLDPEGPAFAVDIEADKPTVQIQIPAENEVMRSDFTVSGMAFDDDGVSKVFWRLDGSDWTPLEVSNGFAVPFKLLDLADNEHFFEAYAVDLNEVAGETVSLGFRVSREEPVGRLDAPAVEVTNRGVITLSGVASDANGIESVRLSFDNGSTYDAAVGTTEWSYSLDTRIVPDGVHAVYLRLTDGYGTPGLAAGLLSVDNSAPTVSIDTPADGEEAIGSITVGGRVEDGIALKGLSLIVTRLGSDDPELVVESSASGVFREDVDLGSLAPGWYNIQALAVDMAGNEAYDSRNVVVLESKKADYAELAFPAHGEPVAGRFTIDGRVVSAERIERAAITLDGQPFATVELGAGGWFSLAVEPGSVADGRRSFRVEAVSPSGTAFASEPREIEYRLDGPWVDIDSLATGDFVIGRPYLVGSAGWDTPAPESADKEAQAAYKKLAADRKPVRVEISRDNGKTWQDASGAAAFKYRLETQEYPDGVLRLTVRATFSGGDSAVRKRMVVLDTRPPAIEILKPAENGRYNGVVSVEGVASDANGLSEVSVLLRSGDKSKYEIPGFIQGSYADLHLLGATRFEAGLGLSFFEDNVRLQVELGQGFDAQPSWTNLLGFATDDTPASELSRFGGYVLGARLLANVAYLPFSYWFGPDWDFFSMSFTLGASFTYFSMRDAIGQIFSPPDDRYMVLSGVVGQWEFAKFAFDSRVLKSVGLYFEGGLVFIPSEASTRLEEFIRPNIAFGARIGLF
ncbi:MAG: Ig-like domain-containing protein [Spirochaetaceae bacterium]|nr:Ig-like domain-containing protein [Spirochaetaceae bacterium]